MRLRRTLHRALPLASTGLVLSAMLPGCGSDESTSPKPDAGNGATGGASGASGSGGGGTSGSAASSGASGSGGSMDASTDAVADAPLDGALDALADAATDAFDASDASEGGPSGLAPDFSLEDVNASSASYQSLVSPKQFLGQISAWYFGHAT